MLNTVTIDCCMKTELGVTRRCAQLAIPSRPASDLLGSTENTNLFFCRKTEVIN